MLHLCVLLFVTQHTEEDVVDKLYFSYLVLHFTIIYRFHQPPSRTYGILHTAPWPSALDHNDGARVPFK